MPRGRPKNAQDGIAQEDIVEDIAAFLRLVERYGYADIAEVTTMRRAPTAQVIQWGDSIGFHDIAEALRQRALF